VVIRGGGSSDEKTFVYSCKRLATAGGVWDLLLSCPFDVEGAVLRTTPVEGGMAARTLEEGTALAGAGSCRGVMVLVTLQFFFCQHSKLKQTLYRMIFLIINYVLDLTPQAPIKPNNLVFLILNYPTTKHTFLQLFVILLDRHVTLIKVL
jgi:hypothetical protein